MIVCPICKKTLNKVERSYICANKHNFDIAKQGYCNVYRKTSLSSGDNKEMIQARTNFLKSHAYDFLVDTLISIIQSYPVASLIDVGCGEGYYTNQIQRQLNTQVIGFDLSKEALKIASRENKDVPYFLSSIFDLPIADESADAVLSIFSPLAKQEYSRILKSKGIFIKVDPDVHHLQQLKQQLYDEVTFNEVLQLEMKDFTLKDCIHIHERQMLQPSQIQDLLKMTPYYYKTKPEAIERVFALPKLECDFDFIIYVYEKI